VAKNPTFNDRSHVVWGKRKTKVEDCWIRAKKEKKGKEGGGRRTKKKKKKKNGGGGERVTPKKDSRMGYSTRSEI
jgi:hypothetical protein